MKFSSIPKSLLCATALACLALVPAYKPAAATPPTTTTFTVNATVEATCLISTTSNLAFGTYTGTQLDATSTLSVTCTNTTPYTIGLNPGATSGATVTTRQMKNTAGTVFLNYSLYSESTRTTNWGDIGGSGTFTDAGNGSAQSITVYGRIPGNQYIAPGTYNDTITATISY